MPPRSPDRIPRRPWRSLRARITVAATLIVAAVMVVGSLAFSALLGAEVRDTTARAAEARAQEIALRADEFGTSAVGDLDDDIAQVVDGSGRVSDSRKLHSDLASDALEGCVVDELEGLRFSPATGGEGTVSVTLQFDFVDRPQ
jgi:hypothetical protein